MLEQVEWGEFKLGNLFNIENTLSFNKDRLTDWDDYDYVTRTSLNQGILQSTWFVNSENLNESWVRSLWLLQMDFFFRRKKWYAWQFIRKIIPKFNLSQSSILFFSVILNWTKNKLLSVLVRDVDDTFRETVVKLPIKNGTIDFEFIDKFIAELEAEHQAELEAYFETTGLKDYELTSDELKALNDFENWKIKWKEFDIWWENWLFTINTSKKKFDANKVIISEYWNPYVVRTSNNNWLRGYLNEDELFLNAWNTISFGQDTATMFYQDKPYFTWDKIKVVKSKSEKFNKANAHFFITSMTKAFSTFSRWQSSFNVKIIEKQKILLPVLIDKPDYELMKTFITAIKKLVIKDVVVYNQERLNATAEVINN